MKKRRMPAGKASLCDNEEKRNRAKKGKTVNCQCARRKKGSIVELVLPGPEGVRTASGGRIAKGKRKTPRAKKKKKNTIAESRGKRGEGETLSTQEGDGITTITPDKKLPFSGSENTLRSGA